MNNKYLLGPVTAALFAIAAPAAAEPAFTANKAQVGAQLDYGVYTGENSDQDFNPYGVGFGLRAGYTLDFGLYVGGNFDYFIGDSRKETISLLGVTSTFEASANIYQFGAEVGYDIGLGAAAVVRPKLGLGLGTGSGEVTSGGMTTSNSESGLLIAPGVQALYNLNPVFLTLDLRYNIFNIKPEGASESLSYAGFLMGAGAGLSF